MVLFQLGIIEMVTVVWPDGVFYPNRQITFTEQLTLAQMQAVCDYCVRQIQGSEFCAITCLNPTNTDFS